MMFAMVTVKALAAAALLGLAALPVPASGAPEGLVVRKWLALDAVDRRARVPFNGSAPFARYLLDRAAPPPKADERVMGDLAEAAWRPVEAGVDGTVSDEKGAWFYGEVETPGSPAETVHLAYLAGAATLFVNGAGFVGDVYGLGTGPVPVALRAGVNRLFVAGPRGPWSLRFEAWTAGTSPVLPEDATLPDLVEGAPPSGEGSFRMVNASLDWVPGAEFPVPLVDRGVFFASSLDPAGGPAVAPLWTGKARAGFAPGAAIARVSAPKVAFSVSAESNRGGKTWRFGRSVPFEIGVRGPGAVRQFLFLSAIDGTLQPYALLPPSESEAPPEGIGTVLTLHGAGVNAFAQAAAYSARPDFRIVAPTNRRPFGFDWQDWGRIDAYEALGDAMRRWEGDWGRVFLTGHSMGGHGVWHLAANDPDRWAAIAPSAGWCSFDTYGGGPRPETPLTPLWRACDGGSRTEDLVANLAPLPTFVLHGTKDDNVPLSEAEAMLSRLEKAGGKPLHRFQEGAGHWWDGDAAPGVDCVDWPGIFELFRAAPARKAGPVDRAPEPRGPAAGPFKRAFDRRFVLVVGTKGTGEENREMLELARFHAETWWYRANGSAPVVRDADFLAFPKEMAGRNVVLYGNADGNAAWRSLLPAGGPVDAGRGAIRVGERSWKGDALGAAFVRPRPGEDSRLVGAFASTGARGTRLGYGLVPFVSGVGYPDYAVYSEEFLRSGDGGVLAAGWFDGEWRLQAGGFVREGR
jgi:dienelactone hydrolase